MDKRYTSIKEELVDNQRIYRISLYMTMYGLAVLFLIPYWRMFELSIMPSEIINQEGFFWIPPDITLAYWEEYVFTQSRLLRWGLNSVLISSVTTALVLIVDSMIAFSLTRLDWPGKKVVFTVIVASFMIPGYVNLIPLFELMDTLNLLNSYLGIILPFAAGPLGVFLLVQFFRDIPDELEEAARLDGFSSFQIYVRIILPMATPIMTALGLFIFVWSWNQFLWPLIVLNNEAAYTLPIGAVTLQTQYSNLPNAVMASVAAISLPLFLVFLLFQDKLISSIQIQSVG